MNLLYLFVGHEMKERKLNVSVFKLTCDVRSLPPSQVCVGMGVGWFSV